jgi:hypothetical protein
MLGPLGLAVEDRDRPAHLDHEDLPEIDDETAISVFDGSVTVVSEDTGNWFTPSCPVPITEEDAT